VRPLELTMEGFRSHRDRHTFEFEGRTLFAIVGPTGAGKSSILEAIVFALYGKTVREERATKNLINSRSDETRVQLLFDADGSVWEVTRVLRRKGASEFVIRSHDDDAAVATGERSVNAKIVELTGLDFEAFCSSVVLAQGDFDRFLRAAPGPRSKILKGVFALERIDHLREAARAKVGNLQGRLQALQAELGTLPTDPSLVDQLQTELENATRRLVEIREGLEVTAKAEQELRQFDSQMTRLDSRIEQIERALASIPQIEDLEELAAAEGRAEREKESSQSEAEASAKAFAAAEDVLAKAEEASGGRPAVDAVRDLERLRRQIKTLEMEKSKNEIDLKEAERNAAKAKSIFEGHEKERVDADKKVSELHRIHAAHLLRKDLAAGEPCPVCEQEVISPPAPGRVAKLDSAERALKTAQSKTERARADLEKASQSTAVVAERLGQNSARLTDSRAEIEAVAADLVKILGQVEDPVEEVRSRQEAITQAANSVRAARKQLEEFDKKARASAKKTEEIATLRRRFAGVLIQVCAAIQIAGPAVDADSDELLDASKRADDTCGVLLEEARRERRELETSSETRRVAVAEFRSKYQLSDEEPLTKALEDQTVAAGALRAQIETVKEGLARAHNITKECAEVTEEKDRYSRLTADLSDHRFTAYLLDGRRRLLAQLGSEKLFELTGRYRFDDEGEFNILDETNGTKRTAETLSGGETFLASLALALALAEVVAQQGGRLGCFFLDEGFGSLDSESLDLALEGIESIAVPGRLIGLISHVGGIQARLEDLIVLDKSEDGSTEVIQTEGPISYGAATI
jgi:exonuclease SbcC